MIKYVCHKPTNLENNTFTIQWVKGIGHGHEGFHGKGFH